MSKYNIEKFKHVTVALNTPFAKDGSVDVEAGAAKISLCSMVRMSSS